MPPTLLFFGFAEYQVAFRNSVINHRNSERSKKLRSQLTPLGAGVISASSVVEPDSLLVTNEARGPELMHGVHIYPVQNTLIFLLPFFYGATVER